MRWKRIRKVRRMFCLIVGTGIGIWLIGNRDCDMGDMEMEMTNERGIGTLVDCYVGWR